MPKMQRRKARDTGPANEEAKRIGEVLNLGLGALDKRTRAFRRFSELREAIYSDLGGHERLSEVRLQLVDRFASIATWCEAQDALALSGEEIDMDLLARVAGHLRRLADAIGLERIPVDVTDLQAYLAGKTKPVEARA